MDPGLQEILATKLPDNETEAIIKLVKPGVYPNGATVVSIFGDIATCRIPVEKIQEIWSDATVFSLKAPRVVTQEPFIIAEEAERVYEQRNTTPYTGKGCIVGVIDWGFDFTHPNFLNPDGSTRFLAIWDQTVPADASSSKYGYGKIYTAAQINEALRDPSPFEKLGYHPASGDPDHSGSHGTHVTDIAAGNGTVGVAGMAPEAALIGVHLSAGNTSGLATLGDSVRILEAIDFIGSVAGQVPVVINLSVGKHGGAHQGNSLVEQGMDNFLKEQPGRAIVNSAGNYYSAHIHTSGRLTPGGATAIDWLVDQNDLTANELEIWYSQHDTFQIAITPPDHAFPLTRVKLGETQPLIIDGTLVGRVYHRANDPNAGDHHIDLFLYSKAPKGAWQITLEGLDVVDGRWHAWIERDSGCSSCQSKFPGIIADPGFTTGSICNGYYTLAVGAYDPHDPEKRASHFSSAGPTVDGRKKPNLLAPGVGILAARSSDGKSLRSLGDLTSKTGTSMAAPHVTGAIAALFEALHQPLPIEQTRKIVISSLLPVADHIDGLPEQYGEGYLDMENLIAEAQDFINLQNLPIMEDAPFYEEEALVFENETPFVEEEEEIDPYFEALEIEEEEPIQSEIFLEEWEAEEEEETHLGQHQDCRECGAFVLKHAEDWMEANAGEDFLSGIFMPQSHLAETYRLDIPTAKNIFDHYALRTRPMLVESLDDRFEAVVLPGASLNSPLLPGDLVISRALGEGKAWQAVALTGELMNKKQMVSKGLNPNSSKPGIYLEVITSQPVVRPRANGFAKRIGDQWGRILPDSMIVRLKSPVQIANFDYPEQFTEDQTTAVQPVLFDLKGIVNIGDNQSIVPTSVKVYLSKADAGTLKATDLIDFYQKNSQTLIHELELPSPGTDFEISIPSNLTLNKKEFFNGYLIVKGVWQHPKPGNSVENTTIIAILPLYLEQGVPVSPKIIMLTPYAGQKYCWVKTTLKDLRTLRNIKGNIGWTTIVKSKYYLGTKRSRAYYRMLGLTFNQTGTDYYDFGVPIDFPILAKGFSHPAQDYFPMGKYFNFTNADRTNYPKSITLSLVKSQAGLLTGKTLVVDPGHGANYELAAKQRSYEWYVAHQISKELERRWISLGGNIVRMPTARFWVSDGFKIKVIDEDLNAIHTTVGDVFKGKTNTSGSIKMLLKVKQNGSNTQFTWQVEDSSISLTEMGKYIGYDTQPGQFPLDYPAFFSALESRLTSPAPGFVLQPGNIVWKPASKAYYATFAKTTGAVTEKKEKKLAIARGDAIVLNTQSVRKLAENSAQHSWDHEMGGAYTNAINGVVGEKARMLSYMADQIIAERRSLGPTHRGNFLDDCFNSTTQKADFAITIHLNADGANGVAVLLPESDVYEKRARSRTGKRFLKYLDPLGNGIHGEGLKGNDAGLVNKASLRIKDYVYLETDFMDTAEPGAPGGVRYGKMLDRTLFIVPAAEQMLTAIVEHLFAAQSDAELDAISFGLPAGSSTASAGSTPSTAASPDAYIGRPGFVSRRLAYPEDISGGKEMQNQTQQEDQWTILHESTGMLPLIGKQYNFQKKYNKSSGELINEVLDNYKKPVNFGQDMSTEANLFKKANGKIHPVLQKQLKEIPSGGNIEIAVWLNIPMEEPVKTKFTPEQLATMPPEIREYRTFQKERIRRATRSVTVEAANLEVTRTSELIPLFFANASQRAIDFLARQNLVAAIFFDDRSYVEDLDESLQMSGAASANAQGVTHLGQGVKAAVWENAPDVLTNLTIEDYFDPTVPNTSWHSRLVCGIVKNKEPNKPKGYAPKCKLYSANLSGADSLAPLEWAVVTKECTVINQSFHSHADQINGTLQLSDCVTDALALHYPYPTIVQAAGNIGQPTDTSTPPDREYVNHKGFNGVTVGNHDNHRPPQIAASSTYRNPNSIHGDRELPVICALGRKISAVGVIDKSGTSFASPAVAGSVALLQSTNSLLKYWPEACRAILLASAKTNVDGGTWYEDLRKIPRVDQKDGTGALNAYEAIGIVRKPYVANPVIPVYRGWDTGRLDATSFDSNGQSILEWKIKIPEKKRHLKVALAWNGNADRLKLGLFQIHYSILEMDLDIFIYDDKQQLVATSASFDNSYEIADYIGKPGQTLTVKIRKWKSDPNAWTYFGIAWTTF